MLRDARRVFCMGRFSARSVTLMAERRALRFTIHTEGTPVSDIHYFTSARAERRHARSRERNPSDCQRLIRADHPRAPRLTDDATIVRAAVPKIDGQRYREQLIANGSIVPGTPGAADDLVPNLTRGETMRMAARDHVAAARAIYTGERWCADQIAADPKHPLCAEIRRLIATNGKQENNWRFPRRNYSERTA
jgi:hypothetical protein